MDFLAPAKSDMVQLKPLAPVFVGLRLDKCRQQIRHGVLHGTHERIVGRLHGKVFEIGHLESLPQARRRLPMPAMGSSRVALVVTRRHFDLEGYV